MPYLKESDRKILDAGCEAVTTGELTYKIQQLIKRYLNKKGESYQTMAEILGALEGAKIDFTNRIINPYEEKKMKEQGDVW